VELIGGGWFGWDETAAAEEKGAAMQGRVRDSVGFRKKDEPICGSSFFGFCWDRFYQSNFRPSWMWREPPGADDWVRGALVWSEVGAAGVGGEEVVRHADGGEIGMVDDVEDFAAELEFEVFGKIPEFTDGGVPIVEGIATDCVAGQVAVSAGGRAWMKLW
jgi:hypothetical protein